eukprot:gb/GECG01016729.1/.p1 GENE.gb/GECG01016729.1/~~gb/GECG01016729.1/.p1  ORF type:complete len:1147 (+),score=128.26 gb/GECG01016729.1/:1-3441(+)
MDPRFRLRSCMSSSVSKAPNDDEEFEVVEEAVTKWLNHHIRHHELYKNSSTGYAKLITDMCDDCSSAIPLLSVLEVLFDTRLTHLQWWLTSEEDEKHVEKMFVVAKPDQKDRLYPRVAPIYVWERALNFSVLISALRRWGVDVTTLRRKRNAQADTVDGSFRSSSVDVHIASGLLSKVGNIELDGLLEVVKLMSLASLYPQFDCADTLLFHLENLVDPSAEESLGLSEVRDLFSSERHWSSFKEGLCVEFDSNMETIEHIFERSFASFGLTLPNKREICSDYEDLCFLVVCDILRRCRFLVHRENTDIAECKHMLRQELEDTSDNVASLMEGFCLAISFWNVLLRESTDLPIASQNMQGVYDVAKGVAERADIQSMVELIFQFYNGLPGNAVASTISMGKASRAMSQIWGSDLMVVSAKYCSLKFMSFAEMLVRPALSSPEKCKQLTACCFQWVRRIIYVVEMLRTRTDTSAIEDTVWRKTMGSRVLRLRRRTSSTSTQISQTTGENPPSRRKGSEECAKSVQPTPNTQSRKKGSSLRHNSWKSGTDADENDPVEQLVFAGDIEDIKLCSVDIVHDSQLVAIIFAELLAWKSVLWQIFFTWSEVGTPRVYRAASMSLLFENEQNVEGWPETEQKEARCRSPGEAENWSQESGSTGASDVEVVRPEHFDCALASGPKASDKRMQQGIEKGAESRRGNITSSPLRRCSLKNSSSTSPCVQHQQSTDLADRNRAQALEPTDVSIERPILNAESMTNSSVFSPERGQIPNASMLYTQNRSPVFSAASTKDETTDATAFMSSGSYNSPDPNAFDGCITPRPAVDTLSKIRKEAAGEGIPDERNEATVHTQRSSCSITSSGSSPLRECDEKKSQNVSMNSMQSYIRKSRQIELERNMSETFPSTSKKVAPRQLLERALIGQCETENQDADPEPSLSTWILSFRSHVNCNQPEHNHVSRNWDKDDIKKQLSISLDSLLKIFKDTMAPPRIKRAFEKVQTADPVISTYQIFNLSTEDIKTASKLQEMVLRSTDSSARPPRRQRDALTESSPSLSPSGLQGTRLRGHSVSSGTEHASASPLPPSQGRTRARGCSLSSSPEAETSNDCFSFNEFVHFFLHLCLLECEDSGQVKTTVSRLVQAASTCSPDPESSYFS